MVFICIWSIILMNKSDLRFLYRISTCRSCDELATCPGFAAFALWWWHRLQPPHPHPPPPHRRRSGRKWTNESWISKTAFNQSFISLTFWSFYSINKDQKDQNICQLSLCFSNCPKVTDLSNPSEHIPAQSCTLRTQQSSESQQGITTKPFLVMDFSRMAWNVTMFAGKRNSRHRGISVWDKYLNVLVFY